MYAGFSSLDELFAAFEDYRLEINPEWESEFYHSVYRQHQEHRKLTPRQIEVLERIAIKEGIIPEWKKEYPENIKLPWE